MKMPYHPSKAGWLYAMIHPETSAPDRFVGSGIRYLDAALMQSQRLVQGFVAE